VLLANLKRETAIRPMRVGRENTPRHTVVPSSNRAERDRHLVSTDADLARIDTFTGSIGYGDRAEG
jgi:hypothetical protein